MPAALLALLLDAAPAPEVMARLKPAFAGTIVSTYPEGRLMLHEDGRYDGIGRRGDASGGTWSVSGARICLKQRRPVWTPFSYCTPLPSEKTWAAKAPTGEPITVRLEAR